MVSIAALLEGRWEKGAGGVAEMVFGERSLPPVEPRRTCASSLASRLFLKQLFASHSGIAIAKERETPGRKGQVGLQQPLEFQERLVVEDDEIERPKTHARRLPDNNRWRCAENAASCFLRVKRSSCAAATMRPSSTRAAALS